MGSSVSEFISTVNPNPRTKSPAEEELGQYWAFWPAWGAPMGHSRVDGPSRYSAAVSNGANIRAEPSSLASSPVPALSRLSGTRQEPRGRRRPGETKLSRLLRSARAGPGRGCLRSTSSRSWAPWAWAALAARATSRTPRGSRAAATPSAGPAPSAGQRTGCPRCREGFEQKDLRPDRQLAALVNLIAQEVKEEELETPDEPKPSGAVACNDRSSAGSPPCISRANISTVIAISCMLGR